MSDMSATRQLIARLEAQAGTEDLLIAALISDLKDYDQKRALVEHLECLHLQHRQVVAVRTHIVVEAAILACEVSTGANWTVPVVDMPQVYPR